MLYKCRSNFLIKYYKVFHIRNSTFSTESPQFPRKIFSGIQPTGSIHVGNYFGAVKNWVELQNKGEDVTYCIVDHHSITAQQSDKLKSTTRNTAATLLACGIDPKKATFFLQSSVPQHTELCWILGCLTTMARLSHLPQYKEKSMNMKEIPLGLFIYPVLQAADILLYKATHVPVGEDQLQHLQLAHHLANIFNFKFGTTFPKCHSIVVSDASRLKSLRDPTKKMSKSDPDVKSCVFLSDSPKKMTEKIKKAVTDFTSEVTFDPESRPGVSNLINLHSLITGLSPSEICDKYNDIDTGKYKLKVAESLVEHLHPISLKMQEYNQNPEYIDSVLKEGTEKATLIAERTLSEVKERMGFLNLKL